LCRTAERATRSSWLLAPAFLVWAALGCDMQTGTAGFRPSASEDEDVWAIRCIALRGPKRFQMAKDYADALKAVDGVKADLVQVFQEGDQSAVYYGRYRRVYKAETAGESFRPDHLKDLELIRSLSLRTQDPTVGERMVWPFRLATMATLPTRRSAHPEWELSNAKGYYSLQVAVFYNTEDMRRRKYAAEEYCRLLREEGEEAYYDHGPVNSSVCMGAFPEEAIKTFQQRDPLTGIIRVTSKIVDERMLELQRKYPFNLHNGSKFYEVVRDPKTGKEYRDPHTSFAVEIPRPERGTSPFE
jgi:hypothetical protein